MTKQEEIKEQLLEFANENYVLRPTGVSYQECMVDDMLNYLHSQGVVIKVDRELPYYCVCEDEFKPVTMLEPSKNDFSHSNECHLYNQGFKAGYVAVEPLLIKEE